MFAKALITCTACRVPGIGSTAVFGGATCCMTGSDRGGYNDRSPRVAQFSLKQTKTFLLKIASSVKRTGNYGDVPQLQ